MCVVETALYSFCMMLNSEGQHYGLGLSIAKAVAEKHDGSISVSCQNGKIRFIVSIPIK
jgi:nitrogen-specific signal transduction histidine kinase